MKPVPGDLAYRPVPALAQLDISALKSAVNDRSGRDFLPTLSMIGHPSGAEPLMVDVRQSGSGSVHGSDLPVGQLS
jgi:hypothetical protein